MSNVNGIPQANQKNINLIGQSKILTLEMELFKQTLCDYEHWVKLLDLQIEELDGDGEDSSIVQAIVNDHRKQMVKLKAHIKQNQKLINHLQEELFINAHHDGVNIENVLYANDVNIDPLPVKPSFIKKIIAFFI